jgi:hypothetical protein
MARVTLEGPSGEAGPPGPPGRNVDQDPGPCTDNAKRANDDDQDDDDTNSGQVRRVLRGFRLAHVFELACTDGDTVRPPARTEVLDGEAPAGLWDTLAARVRAEGFPLVRGEIPSRSERDDKLHDPDRHRGRPPLAGNGGQDVDPELGHCLLHNGTEYAGRCRGRAEVEAESAAFVVCQAAGLTTAAYSFGYVAGWSGGDPEKVKAAAERVVACARRILDCAGLLEPADQRAAA